MACYGNEWIQTPRLNALAKESFVFDNAYVTQPVCSPARSSILTGLYPTAARMPVNRLVLPEDIRTIAEMVSGEYQTGYIGKWHLGDEIFAQHGFEEWVGTHDSWWPEYTDPERQLELSPYHHFLVEKGVQPDEEHPGGKMVSARLRHSLPAELQMASFVGEQSGEFIDRHAHRPFLLYASTLEPHPPFTGPYDGLYDPETMPVEETFLQFPGASSRFNRLRAELFGHCVRDGIDLSTEAGWRRLRANYWGNVKLVDEMMVGRILEALDRNGLADRTIVVFTSDHGDMVGTHGMLEMRTPYEEAVRVPLIIRAPWLTGESRRVEGNFSQIDFVPTLLELLRQEVPTHLQGKSRAGVLRGEDTLASNDVFVQHNGQGDRDLAAECDSYDWPQEKLNELNHLNSQPWRSIITADRWKLALYQSDQCELYDLNSDPLETRNLFADRAHSERVRKMAAKIRNWQKQIGDTAQLGILRA